MLMGLWQLTRVTLRTDARSIGPHLTRVALIGLLLWLVMIMRHDLLMATAPGLRLLAGQIGLTHLFLTLNALFGFSMVIQDEKEAGTLELIRLAGINSLSVLLGKLLPRLGESALLIAIQFPFTLIAITLGGVTSTQVVAVYTALFAYLWFTAMIGIWFSVRCESPWQAILWTAFLLGLYNVPYVMYWLGTFPGFALGKWGEYCLSVELWAILESGFDRAAWSTACWAALGFGLLLGLGAWWRLESHMTEPATGPAVLATQRRSEQVWRHPLVWKEFRYLMSGKRGLIVRSLLFLVVFWLMTTIQAEFGRACIFFALLAGLLSLLDGTWTVSRLFSDEKREQTWSALTLTPHSTMALIRYKGLGWLLGTVPSIVFPYAAVVLGIAFRPKFVSAADCLELVFGSLATGMAILAYLHLLAINSLAWGWKAIPLTLTICCLGAYVFVSSMFPWREPLAMRNFWHLVTAVSMVIICVAMQARLAQLLHQTAGEDS